MRSLDIHQGNISATDYNGLSNQEQRDNKMKNHTEDLIESGKKATLTSILEDIKADNWNCLYFATEAQICKLIDQGSIDEDFHSRHQNHQEEMRVMVSGF